VSDKVGPRVPLEFAKIWRVAQARTEKPVKFGTIAADLAATVLTIKTDAYAQDKQDLMWDIATILNAELRELQAAAAR
jgi:methionine synthase II (cobalamin-independent)